MENVFTVTTDIVIKSHKTPNTKSTEFRQTVLNFSLVYFTIQSIYSKHFILYRPATVSKVRVINDCSSLGPKLNHLMHNLASDSYFGNVNVNAV